MRFETDHLLDAVLAEALPPVFRGDSLTVTLRAVHRRKQVQRWQRGGLAVLLGLSLPLAIWLRPAPPQLPPAQRVQTVGVVASQPLPPEMIVETRAGAVPVVESTSAGVGWVTTEKDEPAVREISDAELLALVAGRPVALVRDGGTARLVFAETAKADAGSLP